jgi:ABC-type sugar transport system ATPase subunit
VIEQADGAGEGWGTGATGARPPLLEFRHLTKAFAGQVAVDDVSFTIERGEIHALVGENGAGKTTLIKMLVGEHHADGGEILLDGEHLNVRHPHEAILEGIGVIHQEPALVPNLSLAENVALGLGFERGRAGLIDWKSQIRVAAEALESVGLAHDPRTSLEKLSVADRQLVAVARILMLSNRRVAIFDEATAPLTETEVERLFAIIRSLRSDGVGVIYVSHRLEEIFLLSDRVTVMRNGSHVATRETRSLDQQELVRLIIGHDPPARLSREAESHDQVDPVVSLRNAGDELLDDVSLDLHAGEILGLAGLVGAGRTNVLEAIFGAKRLSSGSVLLDGEQVDFRHPADAIARGIAMVTEDRKRNGFIADFPVWQNVTLPWVSRFTKGGLVRRGTEREFATAAVEGVHVPTPPVSRPSREPSGGNQQKTILARWLSQSVRVILLDEPTHGVDIGAKEEIYRMIRDVAATGIAVLLVSSELEELELLCTRVLLLREGRVIGEVAGEKITKSGLLADLYQHQLVAT